MQIALEGGGKLDFANIVGDAFGNALGNDIVREIQSTPAEKQQQTTQRQAAPPQQANAVPNDPLSETEAFQLHQFNTSFDPGTQTGLTADQIASESALPAQGGNTGATALKSAAQAQSLNAQQASASAGKPAGYYLSGQFLADSANEFAAQDQIINGDIAQLQAQDAQSLAALQVKNSQGLFADAIFGTGAAGSRQTVSSGASGGTSFDTSLYVQPGFVSQSYSAALAGAADPNNSIIERGIFGVFALATAPLALAEEGARSVLNVPYDASIGGQYLAQASQTSNVDEKVVSYLGAISSLSAGFVGAGSLVTPLLAEAPSPALLAPTQTAEQLAAVRATYLNSPAAAPFGTDIVADIGEKFANSFTNPIFGDVQPGLYYQAQRFEQTGLGQFFSPVRPVDSLDAEIMNNIRLYGNNAEQLSTVRIEPGLQAYQGGVAGGTGQQIFIPYRFQSQYIKPVRTEPLFIDALKFGNRK